MKTKFVMKNKVYDIEKSTIISKNATLKIKRFWNIFIDKWCLANDTGTIYRTQKGNYFLVSIEAAYTLTEEQVEEYLKRKDYEKYVELFGELEEA